LVHLNLKNNENRKIRLGSERDREKYFFVSMITGTAVIARVISTIQ